MTIRWYAKTPSGESGPHATDEVARMFNAGDLWHEGYLGTSPSGPWRSFDGRARFEAHAAELAPGPAPRADTGRVLGPVTGLACAVACVPALAVVLATGVPAALPAAACLVLTGAAYLLGRKGAVPDGLRGIVGRIGPGLAARVGAGAAIGTACIVVGFVAVGATAGGDPARGSYLPQARYVRDCVQVNSLACKGQRFVLTGKVTAQDGDDVRVMADDHGWDLRMRAHPSRSYLGTTIRFDGVLADYHMVHDDVTDATIVEVTDEGTR